MRETRGNPERVLVLIGEAGAGPFFERGRGAAEIDGNIKDFAADDADQFALRILDLEMQAAEDAFDGAGVIVLDELRGETGGGCELAEVEGFEKKSAGVAEDFGLKQEHVGDIGGDDVHGMDQRGVFEGSVFAAHPRRWRAVAGGSRQGLGGAGFKCDISILDRRIFVVADFGGDGVRDVGEFLNEGFLLGDLGGGFGIEAVERSGVDFPFAGLVFEFHAAGGGVGGGVGGDLDGGLVAVDFYRGGVDGFEAGDQQVGAAAAELLAGGGGAENIGAGALEFGGGEVRLRIASTASLSLAEMCRVLATAASSWGLLRSSWLKEAWR